jgi:1,4-dihydroxy-2-naphthoyl-CoA hydrolase
MNVQAHPSLEQPFARLLGVAVESAEPGLVVGSLAWRPELCTAAGVLHGGAIMAFADSLGGLCAFLNLPPGALTTTIESKTNFFRAVRDGSITGRCEPLHVGRTTIVVRTMVSAGDRQVAHVVQTQAVLAPPS